MGIARLHLLVLGLVLVAVLVPGRAQAQTKDKDKVDLRPHFEPGQTTKLNMEVTNNSTPVTTSTARTATGKRKDSEPADESRSKIEMGLTLKVRSVDPERNATVDMTFDSLKVSSKIKGESFDFDSTKRSGGDDDVLGLLLKPLVGSTMTLTVDRYGNIKGITGGEAFAALGQLGSGGGQPGSLFGPIFSPQHGSGMASVGESWENKDKISSPLLGEFTMTTRHTLKSVRGKDANIDVSGKIEPTSEAPSNASVQINDSRYAGKYVWDVGAGMLKQMDTTMSATMEQTVEGVKTTTRNESVTKVTRVK